MSHTNFLGIPVEGDINFGNKHKEQRPLEELQPVIQAALDDQRIEAFRWRQYTPYFNDGDPCVFSVYGLGIKPVHGGDPEGGDHEDGFLDQYDLDQAGLHELKPVAKSLSDAIERGHFNDVLLQAFGDHAVVTVTKDKIIVDEYEHD